MTKKAVVKIKMLLGVIRRNFATTDVAWSIVAEVDTGLCKVRGQNFR